MRIAEVFQSIQGEGRYAGIPSVFVRTTGCNLRCWFCDSAFTSWQPEGRQQSWESVCDTVLAHATPHVVLTGGEPLLQPDLVPLSWALQAAGRTVTIETAGTIDRAVHADLMSISPKLASSTPAPSQSQKWAARHAMLRDQPGVVARLLRDYDYQLKFVIDQPADLDELEAYLERLPWVPRENVWVMPQAVSAAQMVQQNAWLEPRARELGFSLSGRLHIELYGNVRGK